MAADLAVERGRVDAAAQGYGTQSFPSLHTAYEVLAVQHNSDVALPANIGQVVLDESGCSSEQNTQNTPELTGGLYVTPVPSITYP